MPPPPPTPPPPHALHFDAAPEASDFFFGSVLGQGSYAKVLSLSLFVADTFLDWGTITNACTQVFHARMKKNKMEFAVKVMDQGFIRKENKAAFVLTERKVMSRLVHPNIVKFYCSFRCTHTCSPLIIFCGFLFTVAYDHRDEYKKNQEQSVMDTACSLKMTKFYVAEIVQALEYMHTKVCDAPQLLQCHVIHRDLKPDNLLLRLKDVEFAMLGSEDGHLKVTDFGTAKDQDDTNSDINQFCGTVSYVSPEVLHDKPATRACDLWALGCIIFQMLTGRTPFVAENDYLTFQVIINHSSETFEFPESVPEDAQDLIRKLLIQEPSERIGASQDEAGYAELKNHPFFDGIEWDTLTTQTPPYIPPPLDLPEPKLDGASEHWTVAEYFSDDAFSESTTDDFMSSMRTGKPACISDDEQVRFEAKVKIHSKMFKRTRELILTDAPRLVVLSAWSGKFKKEIFLTADTKINTIGQHTFDIISPSGTFRVTDPINLTQNWVRAITDAVSD
ncbi:Agc/pdk1 protein kinase, partial [Globisporangium splendens]